MAPYAYALYIYKLWICLCHGAFQIPFNKIIDPKVAIHTGRKLFRTLEPWKKLELLKISSFSYGFHCEYLKLQNILDPIA